MIDLRAPKGAEWDEAIETLHRVTHLLTTRAHYPERHPAIARAVEVATASLVQLLDQVPELVVAIIDGELVVSDRPLPGLRESLGTLMGAMERHGVECIVFSRGLTPAEVEHLGIALGLPADAPGRVRQLAQTQLVHILLRFAEVRTHDKARAHEVQAAAYLPAVQDTLDHVLQAFANDRLADVTAIRALAEQIVAAVSGRAYNLLTRCYVPGFDDQAAHAINVAMMSAAMAIAGHVPDPLVVEVTAAALLHDLGTLLSPGAVRGLPEPVLDEPQKSIFRHHPATGAWALLTTGCPPLWISVALEHHRGLDGRGYPQLATREPPHELVRTVSLASFFDRKRTLLDGRVDDPDEAIRQAARLERAYFGPPLVTRFVRTFGIYPPGTIVELSDRQAAVVTHTSPYDPVHPQVKLLTGPDAGKRVDLQRRNPVEERHVLSVARAILPPLAVADPHEDRPTAIVAEPPAVDPASEEALVARLGGPDAVPELTGADLAGVALDHRAGFLLTFIDGTVALDLLLDGTGLPRLEVLTLLEQLVSDGVVRMRPQQ